MKTNIKIELGILALATILGIIFQTYVKSSLMVSDEDQIELTGDFTSKTIEIDAFNRIKISANIPVIYKTGEPKVILKTDESLLDKYKVEVENQTLTIKNYNSNGNISSAVRNASSLTVFNNQALNYIRTEQNASLDINDTIEIESITIECDGNASSRIMLNTEFLDLALHGNSNISIKGNSDKTDLSTDGNARFYLEDFTSKAMSLYCSGNSGGKAFISEEIDAKTNGNSQVVLFGNPSKSNTNSRANSSINTKFGE